jgi:copper chaperone CopZ
MKRMVTAIDAIMVENSAVGLARQLARRAGIEHVSVNPRTQTVAVDFDETRLNPSDVGRYIAECGYHGLHGDSSGDTTRATPIRATRRVQGR